MELLWALVMALAVVLALPLIVLVWGWALVMALAHLLVLAKARE